MQKGVDSNMNCPGCGCVRIKYKQKRPKKKDWERTDHTAKCPRCKRTFNMETGVEVKK